MPETPSNIIPIRKGKSPKEAKIRSALDFIKLVTEGDSLVEASRQTGIQVYHEEVRKRLELLAAFNMAADEKMKAVMNASMMSILLYGEDKDKLEAFDRLAQNPELGLTGGNNPLVSMTFSDEVLKLDSGGIFKDKGEEK